MGVKIVDCVACKMRKVEVEDDYEPEYCCRGLPDACGCMGKPINSVFCDECESIIFEIGGYGSE
jgi:hypothetical protein